MKWVHIVVSTVLLTTGIGIVFFKLSTDQSGDVRAIRIVNERTVLADWLFATPAIVLQPLTGLALARVGGFDVFGGWILYATGLYAVAGCCWLPVVSLQIRMPNLARIADAQRTPLPKRYSQYARVWFWLGVPAFWAFVGVYWLMVFKPAF